MLIIQPARVLVMSGQTGGWKGAVAVHSWVVFKRENARNWTRYDVVGWGNPVRTNGWAPDGRWYGNNADGAGRCQRARRPAALIPQHRGGGEGLPIRQRRRLPASGRARTATRSSRPCCARCRNSASPCRRTPSAATIGHYPYVGLTDSGTGIEASLWGLLGVKLGWVEGVEVNVLGLVAGSICAIRR